MCVHIYVYIHAELSITGISIIDYLLLLLVALTAGKLCLEDFLQWLAQLAQLQSSHFLEVDLLVIRRE